jgi:simple sugar transport system permease protein
MTDPSRDLKAEMGESPQKTTDDSMSTFLGSMWEQILGFFKWPNLRRSLIQVGWAIMSIILALLVTSLIMLATGYNPIVAYSSLIGGALLQPDLILWYATPLILTGLSVALAFKAGLFNIGAEGQLYMGSMAAAVVGFMFILPIFIHPLIALLFGAVVGGLWALVPGLLKAYRGAHEVVTTMMMTYIALLFTTWLAAGPLRDPTLIQPQPQTPVIWPSAELFKLFGSSYVSFGFIVGILCVIGIWILLKNTVLGYEMRAVGINEAAAEAAGINPKKMIVISLFFSGCLAGLAGAVEILGYYHRFYSGWSQGLGFDGITVAVLGANSPMGVLLAALFFGFLRAGAIPMQVVGRVPAEMVGVIQGLVVLFVAAPKIVEWLARKEISWAQWIRKDPMKSLPIFLSSVFGLIGGMIILALGASMFGTLMVFDLIPDLPTLILTDPYMALFMVTLTLAIIFGVIGLFVFYGLLKVEKRALWAFIPLSIVSILLGVVNTVYFGGTLLIPLLVLGILGLVFAVWSYRLIVRQGVTYGGEF